MKGLILAGGFATRLRPLSCSKPKLLFPVVGVPLIDLMIGWLKNGAVTEVILAVNHLSERLKLEVGEERLGSRIIFSVERDPLGTAGPILLAREMLRTDPSFVAVNGDIVSNIDLGAMLRAHEDRSGVATVALVPVKDPRQYGSVTVGAGGRIAKFEEKKVGRVGPGLVNAGVYVLSSEVMDYIPHKGPVSLERDVFPRLVEKGLIWSWKHRGYWYDIGRISEYRRANMILLSESSKHGRARANSELKEVLRVDPVHVGTGSSFGRRVRLGPNCILSERVRVDDSSTVKNSIVFEDTSIGEGCAVDGAMVGERVFIGKGSKIGRGAVIAGEISVPDGSVVKPGSVILA